MKLHPISLPIIALCGVVIYQALRYDIEPAYVLALFLLFALIGARVYSRSRRRRAQAKKEERQLEVFESRYQLRNRSSREVADLEEGGRRARGREALMRAVQERLDSGRP